MDWVGSWEPGLGLGGWEPGLCGMGAVQFPRGSMSFAASCRKSRSRSRGLCSGAGTLFGVAQRDTKRNNQHFRGPYLDTDANVRRKQKHGSQVALVLQLAQHKRS